MFARSDIKHFLSANPKKLIIALLVCAYLVPVWLYKYFPTQDGPSHLYNSQVLKEYRNPEYNFRDVYDLNLSLFPNWISHISLVALMNVFSPLTSEKVFLTIYIILFPLSIFYFLNSLHRGKDAAGFIGFLFIYNYLFLMGFYSFAISMPLFFFVLGYWWKNKDSVNVKKALLLSLLFLVIYFSHLMSYVVAVIAISILSVIYYRKRIKEILITLACCIFPSGIPLLLYLPSSVLLSRGAPKIVLSRSPRLLREFVSMRILVSYSEDQSKIAYLVSAFMLYLFIYTLWKEKIARKGSFLKRFTKKDIFLLVFFVLLSLYLILPWTLGPGGWINDRMAILASVLILAWFAEIDSRRWKRVFIALVVLLSLVNIVYIGYYCKILNTELDEYMSGKEMIQKNKVILPFFFDIGGSSKRIRIIGNAANYYCLDNGGINLGNYELLFDYFPLKLKESFQTPVEGKNWVSTVHWRPAKVDICAYSDNLGYLLIWGEPPPTISTAIQNCYHLMISNGRLKIFEPNLR